MPREDTYVTDPENTLEMTRLIEQDRIITKGLGGVFPEYGRLPDDVQHILDIGCGSGGWVLDVAYQYPECEVVGLDVSTTLINYARARAAVQERRNAVFVQGNVLKPLEFADGEFDLVNIRFATAFLLRDAWLPVLREMFRILRPGGTMRVTETDTMGISTSPALEKMLGYVYQMLRIMGYGFSSDNKGYAITSALEGLLTSAGFEDIRLFPHMIDFSFDAELHQNHYENYLASFSPSTFQRISEHGIATLQELEDILNRLRVEMLQKDFQGMWYILTARGIKPA
jgi:ubiquinone/menaquinone biosynthesis C-methylase UbiE